MVLKELAENENSFFAGFFHMMDFAVYLLGKFMKKPDRMKAGCTKKWGRFCIKRQS